MRQLVKAKISESWKAFGARFLRGGRLFSETMNGRSAYSLWGVIISLFLIVALAVIIGLLLSDKLFRSPSTTRVTNTAAVVQQIQSLSDLVTVKYVMEKVVIVEDAKWYGESRILLVAHGIVKAGIDFRQLKPEHILLDKNKIQIQLPAAHVTDAYLDERRTEIIERSTGLLRQFDKDLEQNARRMAVADIRSAALGNGILNDANTRARELLTHLLQQLGYPTVEIKMP